MMKTRFFKAHALGNDFILIKTEDLNGFNKDFVLKLNDRFRGIGCNQLLIVDSNKNVRIWDEDGSIASLCGNGLRCLAKLFQQQKISFNTDCGTVHLENLDNGLISMHIQRKATISFEKDHYLVDVGNLNKIFFVQNNTKIDIKSYKNNEFNYSFLSRIDDKWSIRTMEMSTQFETYACGSAAIASAYALKAAGYDDLTLHFRLGHISHQLQANDHIIQIGPATIVAELFLF